MLCRRQERVRPAALGYPSWRSVSNPRFVAFVARPTCCASRPERAVPRQPRRAPGAAGRASLPPRQRGHAQLRLSFPPFAAQRLRDIPADSLAAAPDVPRLRQARSAEPAALPQSPQARAVLLAAARQPLPVQAVPQKRAAVAERLVREPAPARRGAAWAQAVPG